MTRQDSLQTRADGAANEYNTAEDDTDLETQGVVGIRRCRDEARSWVKTRSEKVLMTTVVDDRN